MAVVGLAGCLGDNGDVDSIRYLGWGGNTQESARIAFEHWTEETGIEVEHQEAGGDAEMLSIVQGNPGDIDLYMPTSFGVWAARNEGLLAEIDYDELPNYMEIMQDEWIDRPYIEDDAVHRSYLSQGLGINTELTDAELGSWEDIKDPDFDGVLGLRDDATSRITNAAATRGIDINDVPDDEGLFEEVVEELEEQHEYAFGYWDAGDEAMRWLREESGAVVEAWGGRIRALQQDGHEHIEYVIPEEGTATITEDWAIPAESENQETVHDLLNHTFQREIIEELSDNVGYPINIEDPPEVIRELPDYTEDPDDLLWVDWDSVEPHIDDWEQAFEEVQLG
jgi:spermidine/putrescine transport system substrate-binding protein